MANGNNNPNNYNVPSGTTNSSSGFDAFFKAADEGATEEQALAAFHGTPAQTDALGGTYSGRKHEGQGIYTSKEGQEYWRKPGSNVQNWINLDWNKSDASQTTPTTTSATTNYNVPSGTTGYNVPSGAPAATTVPNQTQEQVGVADTQRQRQTTWEDATSGRLTSVQFNALNDAQKNDLRWRKEQELQRSLPGFDRAGEREKLVNDFMNQFGQPAVGSNITNQGTNVVNTANSQGWSNYNVPSGGVNGAGGGTPDPLEDFGTFTMEEPTGVTTTPSQVPMDTPVAAEAPVVQGAPDVQMPARVDFSDYMRYPLVEALTKGVTGEVPYMDQLISRAGGALDAANPYDQRMDAIIKGQEAPINRKWDTARENLENRFAVLNQLGSPAFRAEMRELEESRAAELGNVQSQFQLEAARNQEAMRSGRLQDLRGALTQRENMTQQRLNALRAGQQQEFQQGRQTGLDQERTAQNMNDQYRQYMQDYRDAYYHPLDYQDKGLAGALGGLGALGNPIGASGSALQSMHNMAMMGMGGAAQGQELIAQFLTNPSVQNLFKDIFSSIWPGGGGEVEQTPTTSYNLPGGGAGSGWMG